MATSREHFALDWIKGELLETLNTARTGLESFAEALENGEPVETAAGDEPLRNCVNALHQAHGTLVMLELKGVTLLADHLERLADSLRESSVADVGSASQSLMQGILELPGHLEELQSGAPDTDAPMLALVNEIRGHLGEPPLKASGEIIRLYGVAGEAALKRFTAINGIDKTRKIRAVYQQVLLNLLKGGELPPAIDTLRKVAQGMGKVCEGTPFEAQWQAFGEFVESLGGPAASAPLDGGAVKLLRRVDSEIREIAKSGTAALQRPVPVNLVRQLLEAASTRGRASELLDALQEAAAQGDQSTGMSLSGRQAMVSAATALREELSSIKDRLDLFVRGGRSDVANLAELQAPLKQVASTLSLLGFESSKSIVLDQVEVLGGVIDAGSAEDEATILAVAGALVQVDENLASLTQSGKGEVEKITDEAQRAVAHQTREGLDQVKQAIVDYVSAQWDVRHLQEIPAQLDGMVGALAMIPLHQAAELVQRCQNYIRLELMAGHVPSWEELDRLADALSGIDYYLERLASDVPAGAEDILELAQRSLDSLTAPGAPREEGVAQTAVTGDAPTVDESASVEADLVDEPARVDSVDAAEDAEASVRGEDSSGTVDDLEQPDAVPDRDVAADDNAQPLYGAAEEVDVSGAGDAAEEEPALQLEVDDDFDLSSTLFDDVEDAVAGSAPASPATDSPAPDSPAAAGDEDFELELEPRAEEGPEIVNDTPAAVPAEPLAASQPAEPEEPGSPSAPPASSGTLAAGSPAAAAVATLADQFESDDEIVEIFCEEVDEVVAAIDEHLPGWAQALDDENHQTEIRRAFHTLKGSGRMVGANVLGEMAWSVENMLNRLLDGTVAPTAEFPEVVAEARSLTPVLRDAYERREAPEMGAVGQVMERADLLASGGSLAETREVDVASAARDLAEIPDERNLFVDEARSNVEVLAAACRDGGFVLDDDAMRALHTLAGSASMAGLDSLGELAAPTYELAQALRSAGAGTTVGGEPGEFLRQATDAMAAVLDELQVGGDPQDHVQLIAEADRLLVAAGERGPSGSAATLLQLPGVASILKAHELLEGWHDGAVDLALADEVRGALGEIEALAKSQDRPALAGLAGALRRAHERFEFESLGTEALNVLTTGHDRLLEQFDSVAADQTPATFDDTCRALDALTPQPFEGFDQGDHESSTEPRATGAEPTFEFAEATEDEEIPTLDSSALVEDEELVLDFSAPEYGDTGAPEPPVAREPEAAEAPAEPEAAADGPAANEPATPEPAASERAAPEPAAADASADSGWPVDAPESGTADSEAFADDVDPEILEVFFEEADELLEALDQNISDWEQAPDNLLFLENLLRALHTLKGGARLSGLSALGDGTHEFESFLIEFQDAARQADPDLFDALHTRYDELAAQLARVRTGQARPAEESGARGADDERSSAREAESVRPVSAAAEPDALEPEASEPAAPEPAAPEPAAELAEPESVPSRPPAPEAPAPEPAEPAMAPARTGTTAGANVAPLRRAPEERTEPAPAEARGDAAAQARAQEMVRVGAGLLESLVNLAGESSIIRARVEQGMSDFTGALDEMETTIERLREQLRRLEIETETQVLFRQERIDGPQYEEFDPLEMDRYSQLQQLSRALGESASDMLDLKETLLFKAREAETLLLQQARVNTELQEGLMRSRMVPFSRLVPRLRRTVRQVARELDKDVELRAFNVEGELDRSLLERMVPPLEHMLRNAVDHGIEKPERRRSVGKAESGRIDLRLAREGGDVVIEISDDGAGIDVERVREKAVERGLLAGDAELRDDEICQFVLAPGFSTAASVTQISGRGVGMDVVHSEVKQLGGSINIFSQPGRGTRFVLRVPFTVSVNRALMVSVSDDLYAIPLNTIEGIVLLSPEELDRLYAPDGNTFEYAGVPYRIQYLGQFLGREYHPQPLRGSVPVVLVRSGEHAVAVHVDGVQGSREIVVKSLGPQFAGVGGISGATILGDGSVVVILDLLALIRTQSGGGLAAGKRVRAGAARTRCVMVVDDSVTVRKVTSRLLERQGMDVLVAKDGVEAVSLLQERRPDVMLLDIEMPRMDGFEVLRQVRHDERLRDLPIVMISSRTGTKHQERAADLGVSRFLGKPFQESELLATIDDLVDRG